jgi:hypothetical protein
VPRSANLMHVPNVRLLETGLEEAKWRIGLAWRNADPLDPLVHNFIRLARQHSSVMPARSLKSSH